MLRNLVSVTCSLGTSGWATSAFLTLFHSRNGNSAEVDRPPRAWRSRRKRAVGRRVTSARVKAVLEDAGVARLFRLFPQQRRRAHHRAARLPLRREGKASTSTNERAHAGICVLSVCNIYIRTALGNAGLYVTTHHNRGGGA